MSKKTRTFIYGLILVFIGIIYFTVNANDYTFTIQSTIGLISSIFLMWVGVSKIEKTTL